MKLKTNHLYVRVRFDCFIRFLLFAFLTVTPNVSFAAVENGQAKGVKSGTASRLQVRAFLDHGQRGSIYTIIGFQEIIEITVIGDASFFTIEKGAETVNKILFGGKAIYLDGVPNYRTDHFDVGNKIGNKQTVLNNIKNLTFGTASLSGFPAGKLDPKMISLLFYALGDGTEAILPSISDYDFERILSESNVWEKLVRAPQTGPGAGGCRGAYAK